MAAAAAAVRDSLLQETEEKRERERDRRFTPHQQLPTNFPREYAGAEPRGRKDVTGARATSVPQLPFFANPTTPPRATPWRGASPSLARASSHRAPVVAVGGRTAASPPPIACHRGPATTTARGVGDGGGEDEEEEEDGDDGGEEDTPPGLKGADTGGQRCWWRLAAPAPSWADR